MYIKILDYLISKLEKMREHARTPKNKGMTVYDWAKQQKYRQKKSYK